MKATNLFIFAITSAAIGCAPQSEHFADTAEEATEVSGFVKNVGAMRVPLVSGEAYILDGTNSDETEILLVFNRLRQDPCLGLDDGSALLDEKVVLIHITQDDVDTESSLIVAGGPAVETGQVMSVNTEIFVSSQDALKAGQMVSGIVYGQAHKLQDGTTSIDNQAPHWEIDLEFTVELCGSLID